MSRVGNKIINVPEGVTVNIATDNTVTVTGPKGTLVRQFSPVITINQEDNVITVARSSEQKTHKQLHGTTRALLANMIEGVHEGFKKQLEIVGIGYRGQMKGNTLVLNIGYSHQVEVLKLKKELQLKLLTIQQSLYLESQKNVLVKLLLKLEK